LKGAKKADKAGGGKARRHPPEFKLRVVQRMMAGEPVAPLSREVQVKREMLYRWRDAYRKHGRVGLERPRGRPRGPSGQNRAASPPPAGEERIRTLERKVGQQALVIDFLQRVRSADRRRCGPRLFARHDVTNACTAAPCRSCCVVFFRTHISSSSSACFIGVQSCWRRDADRKGGGPRYGLRQGGGRRCGRSRRIRWGALRRRLRILDCNTNRLRRADPP
jgi:transposase